MSRSQNPDITLNFSHNFAHIQVIFQVALAILDANRSKLLSVDDDGEGMTILSEYLDNITNREYDSPFKSTASSIRATSTGVGTPACYRPLCMK